MHKELNYDIIATDKDAAYDMQAKRLLGHKEQIIINVEAQKDEPKTYNILNRAIFYVCRLISSQKDRDIVARSKTIKLFLMDGEASGRIKCSLANRTGIAYKIPRTALGQCKNIQYLKQSGVYFLFGTDEKYDPVVYIGRAGTRKDRRGI